MAFKMKRGNSGVPFKELGSSQETPLKQITVKKPSIEYFTQAIDTSTGSEGGGWRGGTPPQHYIDGVLQKGGGGTPDRHWSGAIKGSTDALIMDFLIPGVGAYKSLKYAPKLFKYTKGKIQKLFKGKPEKFNPKTLTQRDLNPIQKFVKDKPYVVPVAVSAYTSGLITEGLKSETEKSQSEYTKKGAEIITSSRDSKIQENIDQVSADQGVDFADLENKQIDRYIEYSKKINPDFVPTYDKEAAKQGVRKVTNYPVNRGTMSKNMRNKEHKFYNEDFNFDQADINDIIHVAGGDTTKIR